MAICGFITLENPCRANKSVYKKVTQDEDETEISCVDEESAYKELTQHEDEADGDIDQSESDTDLWISGVHPKKYTHGCVLLWLCFEWFYLCFRDYFIVIMVNLRLRQ